MSWYYRNRGTMRDGYVRETHRQLIESTGAYWRPYSFYKGMNVWAEKPSGRTVSVHIQRKGHVRMQHKTLCGLLLFEEVKDFDYDSPQLCKACARFDMGAEQMLLNQLSKLATKDGVTSPRTYARDRFGKFAKARKVQIVR